MIAAWCNGQLLAPFTVEGACHRSVFEIWLETCLVPTLKSCLWQSAVTVPSIVGSLVI